MKNEADRIFAEIGKELETQKRLLRNIMLSLNKRNKRLGKWK